jgi:hypothetical protein
LELRLDIATSFVPKSGSYRILGEKRAALPTIGRYPMSRIQRGLE